MNTNRCVPRGRRDTGGSSPWQSW